ncbi:MAG: HI1506-related protein [Desulfovibrionaceae bacterium]
MSIIITAKHDGFRRCGIAHTAEATTYLDDAFTSKQLAILKAEPMLVVQMVEDEPDHAEPDKAKAPAGADENKTEAEPKAKAETKKKDK